MSKYTKNIGLEVHIELSTKTKIFCDCMTAFGGEPNTHTCPVCMGYPGALPVLNKRVVGYAVSVGLALNCHINKLCRFDRKNYFYPDNPQNYQISQLYIPVCTDGYIDINSAGFKRIRIHELHMEEDAGKLIHDDAKGISLIDFNRAGVPLIEIVTEPDMESAEEVITFLEALRDIITYLGVSDCRMNEGSMRVDVNLSLREEGSETLGTRTEMKNLNSFRTVTAAIEKEAARQAEILNSGQRVMQETRGWDDDMADSYSMRSKESANDYRYFPEPDIPPVVIPDDMIEKLRDAIPESRAKKIARYQKEFSLPEYDTKVITADRHTAVLFEKTVAAGAPPKKVSNWIMGETMRLMGERGMSPDELDFSPQALAELISLCDGGKITTNTSKDIFELIFDKKISDVGAYVEENKLTVVADESELEKIIDKIITENPEAVEDYLAGKKKAMGFFTGQVMRATGGKASPKVVQEILIKKLS